jgi:hypothetical protein
MRIKRKYTLKGNIIRVALWILSAMVAVESMLMLFRIVALTWQSCIDQGWG